ncbi:dihydrofolate reductase family protein [Knoellia subterranea]|uniref:Deaminase reductase n=1 Tax=Knoellia subterranea KCTC 19937 TaxID=1385521 RepID=A0A0A0JPH7_9MICO|nr:dihydrofolate reductase family protein [Knoellia subterranea]KGN39028.1 deaminase reductase [Knoellia subterranea KCTC 19937]
MRTLIVSEFISLDGVVESPDWTFEVVEYDEAAYAIKGREQEEAGCLLLGRQSYDEFAPVWPTMEEFADYNAMPKYVVSSTLENPEWNNTTVLRSLDEVAALKESDEPGTILVHASATLAQGLAEAGLVDRYHLLVYPVVLGTGKRLFPTDSESARQKLSLAEHAVYSNGIQLNVLDVVR